MCVLSFFTSACIKLFLSISIFFFNYRVDFESVALLLFYFVNFVIHGLVLLCMLLMLHSFISKSFHPSPHCLVLIGSINGLERDLPKQAKMRVSHSN